MDGKERATSFVGCHILSGDAYVGGLCDSRSRSEQYKMFCLRTIFLFVLFFPEKFVSTSLWSQSHAKPLDETSDKQKIGYLCQR